MLYTHVYVDLDNVFCLWVWKRFVNSRTRHKFVPASWNGRLRKGDYALDLEAGGRGIKGEKSPGGQVSSASAIVVSRFCGEQIQKLLAPMVEYVDAQDRSGNAAKALGVDGNARIALTAMGINTILRALKLAYPNDDEAVVEEMFKHIDLIYSMIIAEKVTAPQEAKRAEWFSKDVAILRNPTTEITTTCVMKKGAKVVVIVDGNNLLMNRNNIIKVMRNIRMDHLQIWDVVSREEGWWHTEDGRSISRGSKRNPASTPSRFTEYDLAKLVSVLLSDI